MMKCICAAYVDSRKKHFEPPYDKTNKMTFVPSEDSDQPGQRNPRPLAHHIDTQPIPKIPHLHMIDKAARNICIL